MHIRSVRRIAAAALIAAVYAALTMGLSFMSYGPIQFRVAEVLCILPFFFPWTAWGVTAGCLIANLISAYGPADVVLGTLATLLSCLAIAALGRGNRQSWLTDILVCLMPVLFNAVIVGAMIAWFEAGSFSAAGFWAAFAVNGLSVGAGELAVMFVLGLPLIRVLPNSGLYARMQIE